MPHCLFVCLSDFFLVWLIFFVWLFDCFDWSTIVHWEEFLDRTGTKTLSFLQFVCLSVFPGKPVHVLTIERLGLD